MQSGVIVPPPPAVVGQHELFSCYRHPAKPTQPRTTRTTALISRPTKPPTQLPRPRRFPRKWRVLSVTPVSVEKTKTRWTHRERRGDHPEVSSDRKRYCRTALSNM